MIDQVSEKSIAIATVLATAVTISENLLIAIFTLFLGIIGYFIQRTLAAMQSQITSLRAELEQVNATVNKTQGSITYQDGRIKDWHNDRREIFDRLRAVEVEAKTTAAARPLPHAE